MNFSEMVNTNNLHLNESPETKKQIEKYCKIISKNKAKMLKILKLADQTERVKMCIQNLEYVDDSKMLPIIKNSRYVLNNFSNNFLSKEGRTNNWENKIMCFIDTAGLNNGMLTYEKKDIIESEVDKAKFLNLGVVLEAAESISGCDILSSIFGKMFTSSKSIEEFLTKLYNSVGQKIESKFGTYEIKTTSKGYAFVPEDPQDTVRLETVSYGEGRYAVTTNRYGETYFVSLVTSEMIKKASIPLNHNTAQDISQLIRDTLTYKDYKNSTDTGDIVKYVIATLDLDLINIDQSRAREIIKDAMLGIIRFGKQNQVSYNDISVQHKKLSDGTYDISVSVKANFNPFR